MGNICYNEKSMNPRRIAASAWINYFCLFATYAVLTPYLQLYLKGQGLAPSQIGVLLGVLELAGIAGPILLGHFADRRSTYRVFLVAMFIVPLVVFIPLELTKRFWVYVLCIAGMGFTYRATIPLLDSHVSRILPDPARQYGTLRVSGSIGFIVVSLVLELAGLASGSSPRAIVAAFAVTSLIAAAAVLLMPPPHTARAQDPGPERRGDGFDVKFWVIIAIIFLGRFGIGAYYSFFSLFLRDRYDLSGVSLIWALGPLSEMLTIYFSGKLIRRFGLRMLFIVSLAAVSVRLALFVIAPSLVMVAFAQLLHAFTFGTFHTTSIAYINAKIAPSRRGMGMAIYNAVGIGLSTFLASTIGGFLLESHGYEFLFLSYAAVPLAGIVILAVRGKKLLRGEEARVRTPA
jgi:PPP family 3-phenylpropionic acid transporter